MIIDDTYFVYGISKVPNNEDVSAQSEGAPSVRSELKVIIDSYERQLLLNALGVTLYNELKTATETTLVGKWKDLVEGIDYTIGEETYRWDGLRGYNKQSLIAFYVFCQHLRETELKLATTGVIRNVVNNADNANPRTMYNIAWYKFIEQYQKNSDIRCVQSSLYQYLNDMNELDSLAFPDFRFKVFLTSNRYGI